MHLSGHNITMQKIVLLVITGLAVGGYAQAQQAGRFEYWISGVDKAARKRTTYHVSENRIEVKTGPYDFLYFAKDYSKDRVVFTTAIDTAVVPVIRAIGLPLFYNDSLKAVYDNTCIIDGLILAFRFEWGEKGKSCTVSNYYLKTVVPAVDFINRHVPYQYAISYPREMLEGLRKGCPPGMVVH